MPGAYQQNLRVVNARRFLTSREIFATDFQIGLYLRGILAAYDDADSETLFRRGRQWAGGDNVLLFWSPTLLSARSVTLSPR